MTNHTHEQKRVSPREIAFIALMMAIAFVLSYIESLLPLSIGIPGVKIGLANLAIIIAIYVIGEKRAFTISILRVVLTALTFGNPGTMLYSFAGAVLSFFGMVVLRHQKRLDLSVTGISVAGGVLHNAGQILVAVVLLRSAGLFYYLPVLLASGVGSGLVIGLLAAQVIRRLPADIRQG